MEDLRSLVRRSITRKIREPQVDITEEKKFVKNSLSMEEMSESKFKLEVAVPIHLPPKTREGACKKVVEIVETQFQTFFYY